MKIRAAILESLNSPLIVKEIELTSLQFGQVLVRILVSGICGSQLQEIKGNKGNEKFLPHLMGHEGAGIVVEIGSGVKNVKPGDKVVMHWRPGIGIEANFPSYIFHGKSISGGKVTTLSDFSIVSENRITKVPNDIPNDLVALLGCGLTTALGTINNETNLKFGESAIVAGCGGVGLNLLQTLTMASANPIIGVDIFEAKRSLALANGADYFINSTIISLKDGANKILNGRKVDIAIDTTGSVAVLDVLASLLSDNGRLIMIGQPDPKMTLNISNVQSLFGSKGKIIKTTQGGMTNPSEDIPRYIELFRAGKLKYSNSVTHRFALADVNEGFKVLRSGTGGRVLIEMGN